MATPFALALQRIPKGTDRILVLADIATARSEANAFETADIRQLFDAFRVPAPGNLPRDLQTLERRGLVVRKLGGDGFAISPEGEDLARTLLPDLEPSIELASAERQSATFNHGVHNLLPYELAPTRWRDGIRKLVEYFPFEDNAFLMTRFPQELERDPVAEAIDVSRRTLAAHGIKLHLASDRILDPDLLGNVAAHMWASSLGVAVFERRTSESLNPNLLAEVGGMLMTGRRCALLKDTSVDHFPTDFVGQVYREIDLDDQATVGAALEDWALHDLGRSRREEESGGKRLR
jgi:hypothetical protein